MIISLIVAIDKNGLMGVNNELPWHLPNDLKYFKKTTLGKPVIMGRKTYESIGKALPKRVNIVVSRNPLTFYNDAITVTHINDAIDIARLETNEECFIIGGAEMFNLAIKENLLDRVYITIVDNKFSTNKKDNNIYFNKFFVDDWDLKSAVNQYIDDKNKYELHFLTYEKE